MKAILLIALCFLSFNAAACECKVLYTMEKNFKDAQYVIKVQVKAITDSVHIGVVSGKVTRLYPPFSSGFSPELLIKEIYKGNLNKTAITLSGTEYCSDTYDLNKEYVLFVYSYNGNFFTRICEHNFRADNEERMTQLMALSGKSE